MITFLDVPSIQAEQHMHEMRWEADHARRIPRLPRETRFHRVVTALHHRVGG